jgi:hypothetical protein
MRGKKGFNISSFLSFGSTKKLKNHTNVDLHHQNGEGHHRQLRYAPKINSDFLTDQPYANCNFYSEAEQYQEIYCSYLELAFKP